MKIPLLLLLFPIVAFANPYTLRIDTSVNNLAATFTTLAQVTGPPNYIVMAQIDNSSASEIEVNCSSTTVPSVNAVNSIYVAGNTAWETPVGVQSIFPALTNKCWLRSVSGTISTGIIRVSVWGY